ncbi:M12 family metallopeptidase [Neoroseomonas lacus]|uniref:M12 family metallopeptidase n=1 Tax=Neoroseomonas lacus TaxID=287609 RepID=UPI00357147AB
MLLNFELAQWPCYTDREHCIVAVARHEFMHAVGVLHEHIRPDAPEPCRSGHSEQRDFRGARPQSVTDYDPDSIMNYCNNIYRLSRPPTLSRLDILTIQYLYGRRQP